ncbi:MAG TPA: hypothetical protein VK116_09580, partial [Planctomycetota bacterium]|nr:hypothetical protein [Planctomycetota bacterium]
MASRSGRATTIGRPFRVTAEKRGCTTEARRHGEDESTAEKKKRRREEELTAEDAGDAEKRGCTTEARR